MILKGVISNLNQSGYTRNTIYVLRAEHRWTQSDLAKRLNVTRQTVAAIENGKFSPSLDLAFEIAFVFKRDITEVFTFTPYGQ